MVILVKSAQRQGVKVDLRLRRQSNDHGDLLERLACENPQHLEKWLLYVSPTIRQFKARYPLEEYKNTFTYKKFSGEKRFERRGTRETYGLDCRRA